MKKVMTKSVHKGLVRIGVAVGVWALCLGAVQTRASGNPSGEGSQTWDCILSGGGERGIAYITFFSDFSMSGIEVLAPTPASLGSSSGSTGRGGGDVGRGGENIGRGEGGGSTSGGGTNVTGKVILFGFGPFQGNWQFDSKSNIVGSFVRLNDPETNDADVTFTGKISSGKTTRLTLKASFGGINTTYQGVIAQTSTSDPKFPDPTAGMWTGFKQADGQATFEQFTLSSTGTPGVYDLTGSGPDYATSGKCLLSSQGKIGFGLVETNSLLTNSNLRATMGGFSDTTTKITTHTTGIQEDESGVTFNPSLVK